MPLHESMAKLQHCEMLCSAEAALKLQLSWPEHRLHALCWPETMLSAKHSVQCPFEAVMTATSSCQQQRHMSDCELTARQAPTIALLFLSGYEMTSRRSANCFLQCDDHVGEPRWLFANTGRSLLQQR